ncbi:MAG: hypothetical protein AVDCRST_MAG93-4700 [uncultured Chloroflexia bacterium]|uniref:Uncharacterized protein n=1 Tax=uncultured Chloroflexia bacterium TaxID=1672391 RepID=A0A6J4KFH5_9CHLR|nr:MAG: hypothetical protein AVDCRST_MAG93-4700 [uncultured Chloroflexia bacterium]
MANWSVPRTAELEKHLSSRDLRERYPKCDYGARVDTASSRKLELIPNRGNSINPVASNLLHIG